MQISPENIQKLLGWFLSGDTGLSSEALVAEYIGHTGQTKHKTWKFSDFAPSDPSDLGRCLRLISIVPEIRNCVDTLGIKSERWKKAANVWDAIAESMENEVGIDWSKGTSAPLTYRMMKDAGL